MWVLPSRSRPPNVHRLVEAFEKTLASTPVELCLDLSDPCLAEYESIKLPSGWRVQVEERSGLSDVYNSAFKRNPQSDWWGFIADDVVPKTSEWDSRLIEVAGTDGMSVPNGGHNPNGTPHFVLGGDLVRSVGWLSLPDLNRLYIDTVWCDIASARGVLRRVPEVVLEHLHFSNGKALMDATYRKPKKAEDKVIYENWKLNWRAAC